MRHNVCFSRFNAAEHAFEEFAEGSFRTLCEAVNDSQLIRRE